MQLLITAACIYTELCFHILVFGTKTGLLYAALSGAFCGSVAALFYSILKEIPGKIVSEFLVVLYCIFSAVQFVYFKVFGGLMQLSLVRMGGDVFNEFGSVIWQTVSKNIIGIILILLPAIGILIAFIKGKSADYSKKKLVSAVQTGLAVLLLLIFAFVPVRGEFAPSGIVLKTSSSTEYSYQRIGLAGGAANELISHFAEPQDNSLKTGIEASDISDDDACNMIPLDFSALASETEDAALKALDNYFASVKPTEKNEYTGLLSGYNIITICAESFSPYIIDEELTPALYKLSHNGFIFENYYGTYQNLTSNGEYTMQMGLYPNMGNTSAATSFEDSIDNYLPFTLGNILRSYGYDCLGYHNNVGEFYARNLTHKNLGYEFKAAGSGLDIQVTSPASDLELFTESIGDYINSDKPFHAYYMTYSAHNPYNWTNAMSAKNRDAVKDLDHSENVKAYIACNLELEYGLEYLLEQLDAAGIADKTAIVLTNDHFPYGLTMEEYNELAGKEIDTSFEKYRNSFICYVPGLTEPVTVKEYCSTADILPTLLNLLGVDYDSRLLAGRDIFSDGIHMAVLANHSFITNSFRYDAMSGSAANASEKDSHGYTQADYLQYVDNLFSFSNEILDTDYYGHVFNVENGGLEAALVKYSDIKNVFHKTGVQFVTDHQLMEADSEEEFGGARECPVDEFAGMLNAVARECNASDAGIDEYLPKTLTHVSASLLLRKTAETLGRDVSVDESLLKELADAHPEMDKDLLAACVWTYETGIMNKNTDFMMENRDVPLTRFQAAYYISNLCTHELGYK